MRHGSLFSGIGGFDLAAEWAGWENVFHCEWNEFGRKVLGYYWPEAESFGDITKSDFSKYEGTVDIISGGFPCQPYSLAGKRKGKGDDRHLWPEMLRVIKQVKPTWVVGENVYGLVNWSGGMVFHEIISDLENAGYEVQPYLIPAVGVDAPHRRDRLWIVAHSVNARTGDRLRGNGNGEKENEGWVGQSQLKFREDGKDDVAHTVTGLRGGGRTVGQGGNDGKRKFYTAEEEQAGNDLRCEIERCHDSDVEQYSTDPESKRLERGNRVSESIQFESGNKEDVANTNGGKRRKGGMHETKPEQAERHIGSCNARNYKRTTWDNFPTQPPVCSRNDGIYPGLAGITVSKHRNESIKAYGNAVVPQVVYQIFKAINEYDSQK